MKRSRAEEVYRTLCGLYSKGVGVPGVENAYAAGKQCMILYGEAYDAYQRVCDKLGVVDDDPDMEIIFNNFLEIEEIMGIQMYHYGAQFGEESDPEDNHIDK